MSIVFLFKTQRRKAAKTGQIQLEEFFEFIVA